MVLSSFSARCGVGVGRAGVVSAVFCCRGHSIVVTGEFCLSLTGLLLCSKRSTPGAILSVLLFLRGLQLSDDAKCCCVSAAADVRVSCYFARWDDSYAGLHPSLLAAELSTQ